MHIELNKSEALILKNLLSDAIEKFTGLSEPQENFIQELNSGVNEELALRNFNKENKKLWRIMIKQQPLFALYFKLFLKEEDLNA